MAAAAVLCCFLLLLGKAVVVAGIGLLALLGFCGLGNLGRRWTCHAVPLALGGTGG